MTTFAALELSVLFVCIWGFIAILLTGQFGIPVILLCMAALVVGYYFRKRGWRPSALIANLSAIIVFIIAATLFATTYNLLSATVHLFLFLQVTKYITRRTLDENRWCYVISLFNIIGASVITTTVTFGPVLIVYVFLILTSLRLYVLAREAEKVETCALRTSPLSSLGMLRGLLAGRMATTSRRAKPTPLVMPAPGALYFKQARLPRRMLIGGAFLTVSALLLSGGLFSVIPRLATQNLFQSYGAPQQENNVSAFSENVEFGAFTEIQLDERVALFVQPTGEERPTYVRMRGVALDDFDGKTWRRSGGSYSHSGPYEFHPLFTTRVYPKIHTYRVMQPPGITTFLFGDSFATKMRIPRNFHYQVDRMAQTVSLLEPTSKEFQYEVESMHEDLLLRRDPATIAQPERPKQQLLPRTRHSARTPHDLVEAMDDETSMGAVLAFLGAVGEVAREESESTGIPTERGDDLLSDVTTSSEENVGEDLNQRTWSDSEDRGDYLRQDDQTTESDDSRRQRRWSRRHYRDHNFRPLTGEELLHAYLRRNLEVPENLRTGRVPELAETWTEDAETTFAKAMAIETRLRTQFGYSLTPKARGNYIDSFLFDVQEGHCEYFATSMAVLLRNLGIPTRVVNGFYSTEWNALSGNFTVRQKDAHSWVEAWMGDSYGWMTFDPTPPSGVGRRGDRSAFMQAMSRLSDAMRMRWYRYVIDYSYSDQAHMLREISRWRQTIMNSIKRINIAGITSADAKTIEQDGLTGIIDWRPIAVAALVIGMLLIWQILRWFGRRRQEQYSPVQYYDELLKLLASRGMAIHPGETPLEFASRVTQTRPEWAPFASLTASYYKARFQGEAYEGKQAKRWWRLERSKKQAQPELSATEAQIYTALRQAIRQQKQG